MLWKSYVWTLAGPIHRLAVFYPCSIPIDDIFNGCRVSARSEVGLRERLTQREERITELKTQVSAKTQLYDDLRRRSDAHSLPASRLSSFRAGSFPAQPPSHSNSFRAGSAPTGSQHLMATLSAEGSFRSTHSGGQISREPSTLGPRQSGSQRDPPSMPEPERPPLSRQPSARSVDAETAAYAPQESLPHRGSFGGFGSPSEAAGSLLPFPRRDSRLPVSAAGLGPAAVETVPAAEAGGYRSSSGTTPAESRRASMAGARETDAAGAGRADSGVPQGLPGSSTTSPPGSRRTSFKEQQPLGRSTDAIGSGAYRPATPLADQQPLAGGRRASTGTLRHAPQQPPHRATGDAQC